MEVNSKKGMTTWADRGANLIKVHCKLYGIITEKPMILYITYMLIFLSVYITYHILATVKFLFSGY